MKHEKFITRLGGKIAHLFEIDQPDPKIGYWSDITSICGRVMVFDPRLSKPGDGRPVCIPCAKVAKRMGWV
jgi:hypothetical protein